MSGAGQPKFGVLFWAQSGAAAALAADSNVSAQNVVIELPPRNRPTICSSAGSS
jgi:hypothetical protein